MCVVFYDNYICGFSGFSKMTDNIESLKTRYFELSKAFLVALQNDRPSDELEVIRKEIREIVIRIEALESGESFT